jgi:hypothetical protein
MRLVVFFTSTLIASTLQDVSSLSKGNTVSRRDIWSRISTSSISAAGVLLYQVKPILAANTVPAPEELAKLQRGHARVTFLLKNWEELTSSCGSKVYFSADESKQVVRTEGGGGGACDKTPLRVQEFMGYKSIEDPLYRADKIMLRAVPLVDPDVIDSYVDTVEKYREKADQTAMMAYTSSWGEANPNGGKEVVDAYLERTKEDVVETENFLREILGFLNLEILPPAK